VKGMVPAENVIVLLVSYNQTLIYSRL